MLGDLEAIFGFLEAKIHIESKSDQKNESKTIYEIENSYSMSLGKYSAKHTRHKPSLFSPFQETRGA